MKRPWQVWLVFAACVAGAAVAMLWLTRQALDADRMRRVAEAEAELEQRVSLALWRMDTELAPIVAEEVVRPPSAYRTTTLASQFSGIQAPVQQQAISQPSASAAIASASLEPPPYVLLQCEVRPDGTWHSPQVPEPQLDALAPDALVTKHAQQLADLAAAVKLPELLAELPDTPVPSAAAAGSNFLAQNSAQTLDELNQLEKQVKFFEGNRTTGPAKQTLRPKAPDNASTKQQPPFSGKGMPITKEADFEQREQRYQTRAQQNLFNRRQQGIAAQNYTPNDDLFGAPDANAALDVPDEHVGVSRPLWVGERLLLARRVTWNGETYVQGCWLDWPQIKKRLLAEAADLLPDADLVPVKDDVAADPGRMLAGLPVRLMVGEAAMDGALGPALRWSLWMGWGAVLVATAAAAALLHGVIALSERRAAFVSSVTHELRTPLTTFRMYAEMLARGMVPDAERRQEYFHTLQRESERLTLLVENVLAYARLERGRKPQAVECVTANALLDRIQPRLAHRAEQAGMQCHVQVSADTADVEFTTDLNVVEQILFNLVDNSAKYAREATDRRIHVDATRDGDWIRLAVRDHGPGIAPARSSRRMQAFGKSAQESADSAPGVGLGLALCRRLARQLGGQLVIAAAPEGGAVVMLLLNRTGAPSKLGR